MKAHLFLRIVSHAIIHPFFVSRIPFVVSSARSFGRSLTRQTASRRHTVLRPNIHSVAFAHSGRIVLRHLVQRRCYCSYTSPLACSRKISMGDQAITHDPVLDILQHSLRYGVKETNDINTEKAVKNDDINDAIRILRIIAHNANTYDPDGPPGTDQVDIGDLGTTASDQEQANIENIEALSSTGHTTVNSLYQLIYRLRSNQTNGKKRGTRKPSGGKEWKALQIVVSSSLRPNNGNTDFITKKSSALALLTLGVILSFQPSSGGSNDGNWDERVLSIQPITKMISSALLTDLSAYVYESDTLADSSKTKTTEQDFVVFEFSRNAVINLLRQFIDQSSATVDIQVINKLAHGFRIGERNNERDHELDTHISRLVDTIFGRRIRDEDLGNLIENDEIISKDSDAAVLSLVASTRPWNVVAADRLVSIATEGDLWFAAENICDAAVDSVNTVPSLNSSQDSVAHSTTRAIIDAALGYRQYRRADHFASKYYAYGGPERYAEARYLHACDTISKVIRKRVIPLIDKQVERVDAAVKRVQEDMATQSNANDADMTSVGVMSEHVREFALRRLRAANMNSEAMRVARIWNMTYEYDPIAMAEELKQRKLTYLQWDDEGCPGFNKGSDKLPLPQLISEPQDLIHQFGILHNNNISTTIGFDCEWGDDGPGVSLLQLSSTADAILLDIPALTATIEGCDALRTTVGKLFSGELSIKYVVGFSCKEDFSRLRASPSLSGKTVGSKQQHWFPIHSKLKAQDLRHFISETHNLGTRGSPLGLSAACEHFLGKALDKSEQCSDWSMRPLTEEQREYAALDAWACAAIHVKIAASHKVLPMP